MLFKTTVSILIKLWTALRTTTKISVIVKFLGIIILSWNVTLDYLISEVLVSMTKLLDFSLNPSSYNFKIVSKQRCKIVPSSYLIDISFLNKNNQLLTIEYWVSHIIYVSAPFKELML